MNKRKAVAQMSLELFQNKLGIRKNLWINDIEIDQFRDTVRICICGPGLPEVAEGAVPQEVDYSLLSSMNYEVVDTNLSYMTAIEKMRKGRTIKRKSSDVAYSLVVCGDKLTIQGYDLEYCCEVNTFFSNDDVLANDWQVINIAQPISSNKEVVNE